LEGGTIRIDGLEGAAVSIRATTYPPPGSGGTVNEYLSCSNAASQVP
jgi:hypothetical protein